MNRAAAVSRSSIAAAAPIAVVVALVGVLLSRQGGYFPPTWGWCSLAFAGALGVWLVAGGRTDAAPADVVFLAALAGFVAIVGLSLIWSVNSAQTVLELERGILVVLACATFVVAIRKADVVVTVHLVLAAVTAVASYSLLTRLVPNHFGDFDSAGDYRLFEPIGYWNGLAVLGAMGVLLAVGLAADEGTRAVGRLLAAVALVLLPVTMYFTFARACWLVLGLGLAVALLVSPARLRFVACIVVSAPAAAGAVYLSTRFGALTHRDAKLVDAVSDGRRLAVILAALVVTEALAVFAFGALARRVRLSARERRGVGAALLVALAAGAVVATIAAGGPVDIGRRGFDSFAVPPSVDATVDLNKRFTTFAGSGRADLWRFAARRWVDHPLVGSGAGSFERLWQAYPRNTFRVRDGHSLYLEVLAELGLVGLVALLCFLLVPVGAALVARRSPLVPPVLGAYAAFLVHAGVDWDWELAGLAVTALLLGVVLLASARPERVLIVPVRLRAALGFVVVGLAVVAGVGYVGNTALAQGRDALGDKRLQTAVTRADLAHRWMPWSPDPLIVHAEAEIAGGRRPAARATLLRAIDVDSHAWQAWLDLAVASSGPARTRAVARARALYPTSREIRETVDGFEASK